MDMDGPAAQSTEGLHLVPWSSGVGDDDGEAMPSWPESSSPWPLLAGGSKDPILMLRSAPMYSPPRLLHHGVGSQDQDYWSQYYCQSPPRVLSPCRSWFDDRLWSYDDGYMEMNSAPAQQVWLPGKAPALRGNQKVNIALIQLVSSVSKLEKLMVEQVQNGSICNLTQRLLGDQELSDMVYYIACHMVSLKALMIKEKENKSVPVRTSVVWLIGVFLKWVKERTKLDDLRTNLEDLILRKNVCDLLKCSSSEVDDAASMPSILGPETKAALSQPMSRDKVLEMNNPYDVHVIPNESRGCSELIELGHKDVQVEPGDASRKRRACATTSRKRSKAWLHFTEVEVTEGSGDVKAQCKHCRKLLNADSKKDGTSRLRRHITDFHKMELDG